MLHYNKKNGAAHYYLTETETADQLHTHPDVVMTFQSD